MPPLTTSSLPARRNCFFHLHKNAVCLSSFVTIPAASSRLRLFPRIMDLDLMRANRCAVNETVTNQNNNRCLMCVRTPTQEHVHGEWPQSTLTTRPSIHTTMLTVIVHLSLTCTGQAICITECGVLQGNLTSIIVASLPEFLESGCTRTKSWSLEESIRQLIMEFNNLPSSTQSPGSCLDRRDG